MCCVDQRHVGHDWPHIHTDATVFSRHTNNVDQTPAFSHGHNAQIGSTSNAKCRTTMSEHLEIQGACKTPTRKTLNRREAANGRAPSQQMRVRAFDMRIQHVFLSLRKARLLCNTGQIDRQRREKRASHFGARRFFHSKQRALLCHCKWCPICPMDTRTKMPTSFGTDASVSKDLSALKIHLNTKNVRDQKQSSCMMAHPGEPSYVLKRSARMKTTSLQHLLGITRESK